MNCKKDGLACAFSELPGREHVKQNLFLTQISRDFNCEMYAKMNKTYGQDKP